MLFNSIQFLVFFTAIVFLFFSLPHKTRWVLLLLGSYYFYMCWKVEYIFLILLSTVIDYIAGLVIGATKRISIKRIFLAFSLITNLGILFSFKYWNFFSDSVNQVAQSFNIFHSLPTYEILLPVGISFYTFQTLSYTIDVYRGKKEPEKHLGIFALYVAFFPQLVAGPIERSTHLMPQFHEEKSIDPRRFASGLRLMAWGFFKKLVIADRLAAYVDTVYGNAGDFYGLPFWIATFFFAFQIYCDFSGYSDIAIGAAKILGYDLMTNFRRPYFAIDISDFWKRWHISLSTWFRDYVYIPLGGNKVRKSRWYLNLAITFLVSGLWHGAAWTFVIWGALHGFYLIMSILTVRLRQKLADISRLSRYPNFHRVFRALITSTLAIYAWVFFRADGLDSALLVTRRLFDFSAGLSLQGMVQNSTDFIIAWAAILVLLGVDLVVELMEKYSGVRSFALSTRWLAYGMLIFSILLFGVFNGQDFIYFQF
ncbi:MAG TPA: MBOAT family protein [Bacteroidetes bacterium]|nr:peptidoglycan O-acetyltransferase [bacterium BMS3Bbin04]HDO66266.1 MBOAT family protein [Bacteroidota bacterium]HEX05391.1 MBOAT family protein [Bacteroidota bacterium]